MPTIVEFPRIVADAMVCFGDMFSNEPQRRHCAEYLTGLMVAKNKTVAGINAEFVKTTDQSCLNRFVNEAEWDAEQLNARRLEWLQNDPTTQYSDRGVIALDDVLILSVGFNRRFSPHARLVQKALANRAGPAAIHYTVAAGATPGGTWHTDPSEGGGRIIGEGCHFVDLCSFLVGANPDRVFAQTLSRNPETDDSTVMQLRYPDGSTATIHYLANASALLPKERWEVSWDGKTARCDNFKETQILGSKPLKTLNQDKGQTTAVAEVVQAVRSGAGSPFGLDQVRSVTQATFAALESCRTGRAVDLG